MSLIPVDEARARLLEAMPAFRAQRVVPLGQCRGEFLAAPVVSRVAVPAFDNAAVDGYAVRLADLPATGEAVLPVGLRIAAGDAPTILPAGVAARIFTGAPVPQGADAVLMQEDCEQHGNDVQLPTRETLRGGQNIRPAGQDAQQGETVLHAGQRLSPQAVGLAASVGCDAVNVFTPRIVVLTSGDEIQTADEAPQAGKIYDSNGPQLLQWLAQRGFNNVQHVHLPDDPATMRVTLKTLLAQAQTPAAFISAGGVSVGEEDHLRAVLAELGELTFWRLAIKPGKPFTFGNIQGIPFFGLPGNPSAVLVCFLMLVLPALRKACGAEKLLPTAFAVKSDFAITRAGIRQDYLRVRCELREGELRLVKHPNQSSGMLSSAVWADGLAVVPVGQTLQVGERLDFFPFENDD